MKRSFMRPGAAFYLATALGLFAGPSILRADAPPRISEAVDATDTVRLQGNVHPLARPEFDRGAAPFNLPTEHILMVLRRSDVQEAALGKFMEEQKNPGSPNYRHWLTSREAGNLYGPSLLDIVKVTQWLESQGFQIGKVYPSRRVIEFSGNAGQVETAFQTSIHKFVVDGKEHWANTQDPTIPRALSPVVAGIVSLHNFEKKPAYHTAGVFTRDKATGKVTRKAQTAGTNPNFSFVDGNSNQWFAVGPGDFANIYNTFPLLNGLPPFTSVIDGTGQSIGIIQRTNIHTSDVDAFRTAFSLPPANLTITINPTSTNPGITPDETEALVDTEWSGAVAPGANINMIVSASTNSTDGVDLSALYAVESNVAPILSTSFGLCELFLGNGGNAFYQEIWQLAALQGISAFVSTGDDSSAGCDSSNSLYATLGTQVSGLASTPYNVAVGGTDFLGNALESSLFWSTTNVNPGQISAAGYIPELPWNDSCANPVLGFFFTPAAGVALCNNAVTPAFGFNSVSGGSGGRSSCVVSRGGFAPGSCESGYAKPTWQAGVGVPMAFNNRFIPDVSLFASSGFLQSFYIICEADATPDGTCDLSTSGNVPQAWDFVGIGGTSVSTPAFAGIMALVNQKTGKIQGNPNYDFYRLAASQSPTACQVSPTKFPAANCIFNDITFGTNAVPCVTGSPNCVGGGPLGLGVLAGYKSTVGYDPATGLGSVNAANLVNAWPNATPAFSAATFDVAENAGTAKITVTRVGNVSTPLYVSWVVQPTGVPISNTTTGVQGVDYTLAGGNFTIPANSSSGFFMFPVLHNTVLPDHTVQLALFPTPATPGTQSTAILTIHNVDQPGVFTLSATTMSAMTKPSGPSAVMSATVTRSLGLAAGVTLPFTYVDETATQVGNDYVGTTVSPITFAANQTMAKISFTVTRQGTTNKTFRIQLGAPSAGSLGLRPTETVTIIE